MSEGVDLIDIYADEEFNQVRSPREQWDFPVSAEESLAANLQGSEALLVVEDLLGLNTSVRSKIFPLAQTSKTYAYSALCQLKPPGLLLKDLI